jgi:hypothetical protein
VALWRQRSVLPRLRAPTTDPYFSIPPEIASGFSDRLLGLLGYRLYKGIMGHVDGKSPGEVLFGDRMAETAYKDSEQRRAHPMSGDLGNS